jgi:hypothetical protein
MSEKPNLLTEKIELRRELIKKTLVEIKNFKGDKEHAEVIRIMVDALRAL